jgi:hypothetical protein
MQLQKKGEQQKQLLGNPEETLEEELEELDVETALNH